MFLGYFQDDKRLMAVGATLVAVSFAMPNMDVLGALGFDRDTISAGMSGDSG